MTLSIWLDEKPAEAKNGICGDADIAIVGGGIIGAGCAYILSRREPQLKTVLFESQAIASGSTGRSAGFVLRGIQTYYHKAAELYGRENARAIFRFAEENQRLLKEFAGSSQKAVDLDLCGSFLLASSLEELDDLEKSARLMQEDGFEVSYLKEDPIDRGFYGAIYNKNDFALDPVKMVRALLSQSNVEVFEREEVASIEESHNGGKLMLTTNRRKLMCDRVLITTNAYVPLLEPWFADKLKVMRGQILVTKPLRKRILNSLCYANYGFEYFRQLADDRLLIGGCRQFFMEEETGYGDKVTRPVQQALENYIKNRFPDVAGIPVDYRFSGLMAFTADGLPLVGQLKNLPGAYFAVGCNGHGLGYGVNMSRLLVAVALDGESPGIFDARRKLATVSAPLALGQDKGP